MQILGSTFGYSVNKQGFKVLNPKVRVIQGDGIDFKMLDNILYAMEQTGWSAENIAFGSGGGLLQRLNRDTLRFAFKCAAVVRDGKEYPVYKSPVTDKGKTSKSGRMKLVHVKGSHGDTYATVPLTDAGDDLLQTVFENGELKVIHTLAEIRERAVITNRYPYQEDK
jgi:nicotinamide phosphoribosyltransferase